MTFSKEADRPKIKHNVIRCRKCGVVLESKHRHDFVACECGTFVDGGLDYVRVGGDFANIEYRTEYEEIE